MNKLNILAAIFSFLSLYSCENIIDEHIGEDEKKLVVNSLIETKNNTHTIYVSLSDKEGIYNLPDNKVKIELFIDNKPIKTGKFIKNTEFSSEYLLEHKFNIGDKFSIVATYENYKASAQLEVLPAPILAQVDTFYRKPVEEDYHPNFIGCKIDITDRKNEDNYYRLSVVTNVKVMTEDKSSVLDTYDITMPLINVNEPLMSEGTLGEGEDIFEMESFINDINIFTDNFFKDKNASLRLDLRRYDFRIRNSYDKKIYVEFVSKFYLSNMPQDEYKYRRIASIFNNGGQGTDIFSESYVVPNNIVGGIGYIGVSTSAEYSVDIFKGILSSQYLY